MKKLLVILLSCLPLVAFAAEGEAGNPHMMKAPVNLQDKVSLQHGAKLFVNYCSGCHSLKYLRYKRMANDLEIPESLAQKYLNFGSGRIGAPMTNAMTVDEAKKFFGNPPPDLTLETRRRDSDWVYSYLMGFYKDDSRPYGYNNYIFPKVGMPNVVAKLKENMGEEKFKQAMGDITNFLTYAGEPVRVTRQHIGPYVLAFLGLLMIPAWLLKKEYWKDVH